MVALQLGSASACQVDALPRVAGQSANPELAALASALGHPIALCHNASSGKNNAPAPASHHGCCDCGMCGATATLAPVAGSSPSARTARPVDPGRPGATFVLTYAPRIAATGPRGPPLDV